MHLSIVRDVGLFVALASLLVVIFAALLVNPTVLRVAFIAIGAGIAGTGLTFAVSTTVALRTGMAQRRSRAPAVYTWAALLIYLGIVVMVTAANISFAS